MIDINRFEIMWGGQGFPMYDGMMLDDGPGPAEQKASSLTDQTAAEGTERFGEQTTDLNSADKDLDQFTGPVQDSPFYHTLLTSGTESTSRAYNNAKANVKKQAQAAGFGYEQPVAQGAGEQMESQEASDLAAVPRNSLVAATDPNLRATALKTTIAGMRSPIPYYGAAGGFLNTQSGAENNRTAADAATQKALIEAAMAAAAAECWIAAATFGGWLDPRTTAVRQWLNTEFISRWYGKFVMKLYLKFGERVAQKPLLVNMCRPLIMLALKKSGWQGN